MDIKEPTKEQVKKYMEEHPGLNYYQAREYLRELAYGGKPPGPHQSWGDYWKSY